MANKKKWFRILTTGAVLAVILTFFLHTPKIIIIGGNYYPSAYVRGDEITGYYPAVVENIFEKLDLDYEISLYSWETALEKMQQGEGHIMIQPSYNRSRESFLEYSEAEKNYNQTKVLPETTLSTDKYKIYTKLGVDEISTLDQIQENNYRVGMIKGFNYYDEFFEKKLDIFVYQDVETALQNLHDGIIDVFVMLNTITDEAIESLDLVGEIKSHATVLHHDPSYILFSKVHNFFGKEKVKQTFYDELIKMKKSGELNQIYKKYYHQDIDF